METSSSAVAVAAIANIQNIVSIFNYMSLFLAASIYMEMEVLKQKVFTLAKLLQFSIG